MSALLAVRDLTVGFAGRAVVRGLSFDLAAGEKLALVGESGSGKTVSAMSLLRLIEQAEISGQALFGGRDLLTLPERELRALRGRDIAMIFQEPMTALNPLMPVGQQIAEVLTLKMGLPPRQAAPRVIELLAETGIDAPERRYGAYPHQLSGGQRQRAMIAMALACEPKLLLADEPTTALDVSLRGQILDLLERLQQRHGMAVLMITHDLNLVRRFAERVLVMAQGELVELGPTPAVFAQPRQAYTQRLIASRPEPDPLPLPALALDAQPRLQARALSVGYPVRLPGLRGWFKRGEFVAVHGADLELPPGRTLGVIGESGSGKSTLALALLGLQPCTGDLQVAGTRWGLTATANQGLRRRVQVVFQDPFSSLSPRLTVEEIVGEGLGVHEPELPAQERRQRVMEMLQEVGLVDDGGSAAPLLSRYPHAFSGGQRQRLAIARALIVRPEVLVLDEPTSALDVTVQKQVLQLLQKLQRERGLSYVLITHDVDVIRAMAHQVIVMKDGAIVESGPLAQVLGQPRHDYTRILLGASE